MKLVLLLIVPLLLSEAIDPCGVLKGFGSSFAGESCSRNTNGICTSVLNIRIHIKMLINGNMDALYLLIQDLFTLYGNIMNSDITCRWISSFNQFIKNLPQLPFILITNYERIINDVKCINKSFKTEDSFQLGFCSGDIAKILTMPY